MKIYLDIDDTLIQHEGFNTAPAKYLKEFLQNIIVKHEVFWLTTHCDGDPTTPISYMSRYITQDLIPLIMRIKPTRWNISKTEGIALDEDFMWFDDLLLPSDERALNNAGKLNSHIKVDLYANPEFLKNYLNI